MSIPYSTERVLDMVIRALRASNVLADDESARLIRSVPNNATDAGLDALAAVLNYGGVSGADAIFAIEDFDLIIDSDDTQSGTGPYFQQFRVERGTSTLPVTDPADHLMSVGYFNFDPIPGIRGSLVTVGPTPVIAGGGADHSGGIDIGYNASATYSQARLFAGPEAVLPANPGFRLISRSSVEISGFPEIEFSSTGFGAMGALRTLRGGFSETGSLARFAVGDYKATSDAILIEAEDDSLGATQFTIRPSGQNLHKLFIRGSYDGGKNPIYFVVGGKVDTAWGDPSNYGYPSTLILGNATSDFPTLRVHSQVTSWFSAGTSVFEFSTTHVLNPVAHFIFRITRGGIGVFNIDSDGDANLGPGRSYNATGADVAEWLDTVEEGEKFKVGTVLIINHEGELEPSSLVADPRVAGVVSDTAGVKLGSPGDAVELGGVKPKDKALVAAVGRVSVRCRADNGSIHPGDLLVSGPDGCAVRGEASTKSAAILGKSLGTLLAEDNTTDQREGKVEALVSW